MTSWLCINRHKNDYEASHCYICNEPSTVVVKEKKPIKKVSAYQARIKRDLTLAYELKALRTGNQTSCSGCQSTYWDDHDHTIAQKRCKEIGKPELIINVDNFEYSCRQCHIEWESYKSGEFRHHKNFARRMAFMKEHDYEGYVKRMEVVELFNRPKETI